MARRNSSGFSPRLQVRASPWASTRVKDSTSSIIGLKRRPRPWALAERAPPMLRRSAPVCFCRMPHGCALPSWRRASSARSSGQRIPAWTTSVPFSPSKSRTLSMRVMSTRIVSFPNCWPPIAWRPPAMEIARPSACAARTAAWMAGRESGLTMRWTRVSLRREWTSLTTTPAGDGGGGGLGAAAERKRTAPASVPVVFSGGFHIKGSPLGRRGGRHDVAAGLEDQDEGDHLDGVVKGVVIEQRGVQRDPLALHDGGGGGQEEAREAGEERPAPVPAVGDQEG